MQPDSSAFYDALAAEYNEIYFEKKKYHDAVDSLIRENKDYFSWSNILDIGSGDGKRIVNLFPNQKSNLHSVENSHEMVSLLRKSTRINRVIHNDFCSLEYKDLGLHFDVILMQWNVLGHLTNIFEAFKLASQSLRPGGHFIFDFNNATNYKQYGISSALRNFLKLHLYTSKGNLKFKISHGDSSTETNFYSLGYVVKLLEVNGFKLNDIAFLNYRTGEVEKRLGGQIFIDAIKV
jgi:SAM-dependent methyltransferase